MGVIERAFRSLGYLKHDDKGQADGKESPVSRGIVSLIIPESTVSTGDKRLRVAPLGYTLAGKWSI